MRNEKFFDRKLKSYYDRHYKQFDDEVEWYVNPAINQWKFLLRGTVIILVCDEDGVVHEQYGY